MDEYLRFVFMTGISKFSKVGVFSGLNNLEDITIFKLVGLKVGAEVRTNRGRIDALVELEDAVFIFEFKLAGDAEEALKQIKERGYFEKYKLKGKEIYLLGAAFEMDKREVVSWRVIEN